MKHLKEIITTWESFENPFKRTQLNQLKDALGIKHE